MPADKYNVKYSLDETESHKNFEYKGIAWYTERLEKTLRPVCQEEVIEELGNQTIIIGNESSSNNSSYINLSERKPKSYAWISET